jgi:hypothetical protein
MRAAARLLLCFRGGGKKTSGKKKKKVLKELTARDEKGRLLRSSSWGEEAAGYSGTLPTTTEKTRRG